MRILHDRLCRASGLYRAWHAHPHHRHHHWLAASLACVIAAYAIAGAWGAAELEQDVFASQLLGISVARAQTVCQGPDKFSGSDTQKLQVAIDACEDTGGVVKLDRDYATDTIELKSGMTLNLNGKILSTRDGGSYSSFKCPTCSTVLIGTDNGASDVGLIGPGTIERQHQSITHVVEFFDATNVTIDNITVSSLDSPQDSGGFHFVVSGSDHVRANKVTVRGRHDDEWGNDGIDIREGSSDVVVSNCDVDTHDDGLVVATSADPNNPAMALDGVTFENCQVASDSASIKFGTGTTNPIRNILYNNIRVHGPKGIRIDNLDGSIIENVTFSNITFEDSVDQMFLCGGGSLPTKDCRGDREGGTPRGTIQNICYTDITVKGGATTVDPGQYGESSINGMRNITLRNINFMSGSGSSPLAKFRDIQGLAFENITYSGKRYDDPRSLFEIQGSVSGITLNGNPYGCQQGSPPADTGDDLPPPACTPGQSCTTSQSSPGTIECEGNQQFCTVTPGDNCPAGGPGAGSGQVAANLDCDTDNNVDVFDLALLMYFWDATPPFTTACGKNADFDGNASVDFRDFPHLRNCWGRPSPCTGAGGGGNGGGGDEGEGSGDGDPLPAACADSQDNDGDGKTDYPADPGCTSLQDTSETDPVTQADCTSYAAPGDNLSVKASQLNPDSNPTLCLRDGSYPNSSDGSVALNMTVSGQSGKLLTIRAEHPKQATLASVRVEAGYVTFADLKLTGGAGARQGDTAGFKLIAAESPDSNLKLTPHHITLENLDVSNFATGILGHCDDCVFNNLDLHDNGYYWLKDMAMYLTGSRNRIANSKIHDNASTGIQLWTSYSDSATAPIGNIIENNLIYANGFTVVTDDPSNPGHSQYGHGIVVGSAASGARDNIIRNNVVFGNWPNGVTLSAFGTEVTNTQILNNTIVGNVIGVSLGGQYNAVVKNNIISDNSAADVQDWLMNYYKPSWRSQVNFGKYQGVALNIDSGVEDSAQWQRFTAFDIDYNLYDPSGAFNWREQNYSTLAAFQQASGKDPHSAAGDPRLADWRNQKFQLTAVSTAALDKGTLLGSVTKDSIGTARANPPDLGAYEYGSTGPPVSQAGCTITVAKDGSGDFTTIQAAADAVDVTSGKSVVCVKDGTYTGSQYIVSLSKCGTKDQWVNFRSVNKWGAVIDGRNNSSGYCWDFGANAQFIRVENFELKGCDNGFWSNSHQAHHIYLYGNRIHDMGRQCTGTWYGQGLAVYQGTGTSYHTYDSNVIFNNGRYADGEQGCDNNARYKADLAAGKCTESDKIGCWCPHCFQNHDHPIYMNGDHNKIVNNVFYDNKAGWNIELASWQGIEDVQIINNTFIGANPYRDGHILFEPGNRDILVANNIFYKPRNYAMNIYIPESKDFHNIVIKNNLVYGAQTIDPIHASLDFTVTNKFEGQDPLFTNGEQFPFTIDKNSPARNKADTAHVLSIDINGNIRTADPGFDLGAYEYGSTGPPVSQAGCTITVAKDGSGDYTAIQAAVNAAGPGDVVCIKTGTYPEQINISNSGNATQPITFRGERGSNGEFLTAIDGNGANTCVAIFGRSLSHIIFDDLAVSNCTGNAFRIIDANNITIRDCYIHDITARQNGAIWFGDHEGDGDSIHDIIIEGCRFIDIGVDQYSQAVYASRGSSNVIIRNNYFEPNGGDSYGVSFYHSPAPHHAKVYNNVFNMKDAAYGGAIYIGGGTSDLKFYHNTFVMNTLRYAINMGGPNNPIQNNIFYTYGTMTEGKGFIADPYPTDRISHNLFYPDLGDPGGSSVVADPLFIDRAGGDFRLSGNSQAKDSGTAATGVPVDFAGNPRDSLTDLGAYEYQP